MAPFLLLLVAEGLVGLMNKVVSLTLFDGLTVERRGVEVSHLQFADDTLIIGNGSPQNIFTTKGILRLFE